MIVFSVKGIPVIFSKTVVMTIALIAVHQLFGVAKEIRKIPHQINASPK